MLKLSTVKASHKPTSNQAFKRKKGVCNNHLFTLIRARIIYLNLLIVTQIRISLCFIFIYLQVTTNSHVVTNHVISQKKALDLQ